MKECDNSKIHRSSNFRTIYRPPIQGSQNGTDSSRNSVKNYHYTLCKTQRSADGFVKFIFRKMILMHDQSQNILVSNLFGCMIAWIDPSGRAD
jgi:hypothetical protein